MHPCVDTGAAIHRTRSLPHHRTRPGTVASVSTSIVHSVSGSAARSAAVTAPGWVPAAAVHSAIGLPASPDTTTAASTAERTAHGHPGSAITVPWSQWAAAHPVHASAGAVPFLAPAAPTLQGHARMLARSGPESGFAIALPRGEWTLGRGSGPDIVLTDPFLSRRPHSLTNSPAGIQLDGTPHTDGDPLTVGATVLIPRLRTPIPPETQDRPVLAWPSPDDVAPVRKPSWIVFAAPVAIGILLAVLVGTWWFLLLSIAGPLTAVLTLRFDRRRHARETAASARTQRREVARTLAELQARAHAFAQSLDRFAYAGADPRTTPDRAALLVLGTGTVRSPVAIDLPRDPAARTRARRRLPPHHCADDRAFLLVEDAPLLVDRSTPVRMHGPEAAVRAAVRSLVVEHLSAGSGCRTDPSFPEFTGLADRAEQCAVVAVVARHVSTTTAPEFPGQTPDAADSGWLTCEVRLETRTADAPGPTRDATPAEPVEITCGPPGRGASIHIPRTAQRHDRSTSQGARALATGQPISGGVHLHAFSRATALRILASMDLGPRTAGRVLPPTDRIPATGIGDLLHQWDRIGSPGAAALTVPLGISSARPRRPATTTRPRTTPPHAGSPGAADASGAPHSARTADPTDGSFVLGLLASGPHALVAGTTGSGKSVLLETWLEALTRTHSPDQLRLVLLDFKGGASLSRFRDRPHTDALVTDLDAAAALRAVRSITAEITRREEHLARAGCRDLDALLARSRSDPGTVPLPRLLIVIDEFHVLTSLSPHIVTRFELLTAVGRSLGVHLILATQRPSGVVTARMKANIALRICLRVRDETDSQEVLGIPDAAWLDPRAPGAALVADESGVRALRCALPDRPESSTSPQVRVRSLPDGAETVLPLPLSAPPALPPLAGPPGPRHEVIAPPLPPVLTIDDLPAVPLAQADPSTLNPTGDATEAHCIAVGLLDLPEQNRVAVAAVSEDIGSIIVTGGRGRGWSSTVAVFAQAWARTGRPVIHVTAAGTWPGAAEGLPAVDCHGILRVTHAHSWLLDHLIEACMQSPRDAVWAIDDWDDLVHAHPSGPRVGRLEQLLTGGTGTRFVVAGQRRVLGPRLAPAASTRIVFPPAASADAVLHGFSADRFQGEWPPGRAVILGAAARTDAADGADVQLLLPGAEDPRVASRVTAPRSRAVPPHGASAAPAQHALWTGFDPRPGPEEPLGSRHAVPLGVDPAGRPLHWHPDREGAVLTIRVGADAHPTRLAGLLAHLRAHGVAQEEPSGRRPDTAASSSPHASRVAQTPAVVPGTRPAPSSSHLTCRVIDPAAGATGSAAPVASRRWPQPSSALSGQATGGPELLVGTWGEMDLRALGHRWLAPLPETADAGWWFVGERAVPIRTASR